MAVLRIAVADSLRGQAEAQGQAEEKEVKLRGATIPAKQGETPRGLLWRLVTDLAPPHDADTYRGTIRAGLRKVLFEASEIRLLGTDACEVSRTRTNTKKKITAAEIKIGKAARDEIRRIVAGGATLEVGYWPDKDMPEDKFGRLLAWGRLRLPDKSLVYLAELLQENRWNRSQLP